MTARLKDIVLCAHCKQAVRHSRGVVIDNIIMVHRKDGRFGPIRLCELDYLAYRRRYEDQGFEYFETNRQIKK